MNEPANQGKAGDSQPGRATASMGRPNMNGNTNMERGTAMPKMPAMPRNRTGRMPPMPEMKQARGEERGWQGIDGMDAARHGAGTRAMRQDGARRAGGGPDPRIGKDDGR